MEDILDIIKLQLYQGVISLYFISIVGMIQRPKTRIHRPFPCTFTLLPERGDRYFHLPLLMLNGYHHGQGPDGYHSGKHHLG